MKPPPGKNPAAVVIAKRTALPVLPWTALASASWTLWQRATANVPVRTGALIALGVFGAALFYGDTVITPAISVLSAVEGLEVAAPGLSAPVVPLALVLLCALFAVQRCRPGPGRSRPASSWPSR